MKILYTKHALENFIQLKKLGWDITKAKVQKTIKKPKWRGNSPYGQTTAMGQVDKEHILRVVINREDDIIKVVTFHITRRGRYESTL